jgi:hypothetical protein
VRHHHQRQAPFALGAYSQPAQSVPPDENATSLRILKLLWSITRAVPGIVLATQIAAAEGLDRERVSQLGGTASRDRSA